MSHNLIDFISTLAERAGYDISTDDIKGIITDPSLAAKVLPESFVTSVQNKLITEDEARINPNLKKYFSAMALNVADKNVLTTAAQYLEPEELAEISKEEVKTIDKVRMILEKVKAKSAVSDNKEDKKTYLAEITKLQNLIAEKEAEKASAIAERDNHWVTTLGNEKIDSQAFSYNFAGETPKPIMAKVLKETFLETLKKEGGAWKYADNRIQLVNAESPELPFSINNKQVNFEDYMNRLAEPLVAKHAAGTPAPVPTPTPPAKAINHAAREVAKRNAADLAASVAI